MPGWFHFSSGYFAQQILGMPEMEHPRMPNFDIKEYGKRSEGICTLGPTPFVKSDSLAVRMNSSCSDHDADPLLDSACMGPENWVQMAEDIEKHCK